MVGGCVAFLLVIAVACTQDEGRQPVYNARQATAIATSDPGECVCV